MIWANILEHIRCFLILWAYAIWVCYILYYWWNSTGGENEGLWLLPDILVNVHKPGDDAMIGVVQEVMAVCSLLLVLLLCFIHLRLDASNSNANCVSSGIMCKWTSGALSLWTVQLSSFCLLVFILWKDAFSCSIVNLYILCPIKTITVIYVLGVTLCTAAHKKICAYLIYRWATGGSGRVMIGLFIKLVGLGHGWPVNKVDRVGLFM